MLKFFHLFKHLWKPSGTRHRRCAVCDKWQQVRFHSNNTYTWEDCERQT